MGENLDNFKNPYPANDDLIRSLDNPHSTLGGLAIMRGNLAPNTGVSKPAAIHPDVRLFTGRQFVSHQKMNVLQLSKIKKLNLGML